MQALEFAALPWAATHRKIICIASNSLAKQLSTLLRDFWVHKSLAWGAINSYFSKMRVWKRHTATDLDAQDEIFVIPPHSVIMEGSQLERKNGLVKWKLTCF